MIKYAAQRRLLTGCQVDHGAPVHAAGPVIVVGPGGLVGRAAGQHADDLADHLRVHGPFGGRQTGHDGAQPGLGAVRLHERLQHGAQAQAAGARLPVGGQRVLQQRFGRLQERVGLVVHGVVVHR